MYELMVEGTFAAAHALWGYEGPCENLHGHTWKVQAFLEGNKLDKIGLLADFRNIKNALRNILAEFDHKHLNELKLFKLENPSSENLARIIFEKMRTEMEFTSKVTVWESPTSSASYF